MTTSTNCKTDIVGQPSLGHIPTTSITPTSNSAPATKPSSREQKQTIQRVLAAAFITERIGYGYCLSYIILKKKNIDITCNCYTNSMTSIVRNVYKNIEDFLKNDQKRRLEAITPQQFRLLRSPLLQAKDWLYKEQLATFYKFVRLTYNLVGDTNITKEQARKLYGRLMLTLQKHFKKKNSVPEKKKSVNSERKIPSEVMTIHMYEALKN